MVRVSERVAKYYKPCCNFVGLFSSQWSYGRLTESSLLRLTRGVFSSAGAHSPRKKQKHGPSRVRGAGAGESAFLPISFSGPFSSRGRRRERRRACPSENEACRGEFVYWLARHSARPSGLLLPDWRGPGLLRSRLFLVLGRGKGENCVPSPASRGRW